ncbi:helix-turn-helix domain-containing protein [Chitinibacteraceae bacterium HSL-7]
MNADLATQIQAAQADLNSGLLTPSQATELLGLTTSTLATMRSRGGGPPYLKRGRAIYYHIDDLVQFQLQRTRYVSQEAQP